MSFLQKILRLNLTPPEQVVDSLIQEKQESNKEKVEQTKEVPNFLYSITFAVAPNGNTHVYMQWSENTEDIADVTGKFLRNLNTGDMNSTIEDVLLNYANEQIQARPFVEKILKVWKESKKKPIIRPRFALKANEE